MPEFLYRPIYDEKHRTLLVGLSQDRTRVLQKGAREPLLCRDCEERLQKYEDYFARLWYQQQPVPRCAPGSGFVLQNLDYTRFKLFLLSIVWRAAVSKMPIFRRVSLGRHEARIRSMLWNEDPGAEQDYPVLGGLIVEPETGMLWDQALLVPMRTRMGRHWAVRMVFGSVAWSVLTTSHKTLPLEIMWLTRAGELKMPVWSWQDFALKSGMAEVAHKTKVPDLR